MSLILNELFGMTYISSSMLMTITKKKSTHSESSIFEVSLVRNISPKNENDLHTNMGIKIPIFHVTKSKTMLAFQNMLKI